MDSDGRHAPGRLARAGLAIECLALTALPPVALAFAAPGRPVLPWLWAGSLALFVFLWRRPDFDRSVFAARRVADGRWRGRLALWAGSTVGLALLLAALAPDQLFWLPRHRPRVWLAVILLYPVFSVVPQTLVYRVFYLHRYRALYSRPAVLDFAAAASFGFMHVVFLNPFAPLLSFLGGFLFVRTYRRTRSVWASAIEHALYGAAIMTLGWGAWFYHGSIGTVHAWVGR